MNSNVEQAVDVDEKGAYSSIRVIGGLRAENQAYHWGKPTDASTRRAKQRLMELFCPASTVWRQQVLDHDDKPAPQRPSGQLAKNRSSRDPRWARTGLCEHQSSLLHKASPAYTHPCGPLEGSPSTPGERDDAVRDRDYLSGIHRTPPASSRTGSAAGAGARQAGAGARHGERNLS